MTVSTQSLESTLQSDLYEHGQLGYCTFDPPEPDPGMQSQVFPVALIQLDMSVFNISLPSHSYEFMGLHTHVHACNCPDADDACAVGYEWDAPIPVL